MNLYLTEFSRAYYYQLYMFEQGKALKKWKKVVVLQYVFNPATYRHRGQMV